MKEIEGAFKELGENIHSLPKVKCNFDSGITDPFVYRMKRWLLIGLTALVGGIAVIMILIKIFGMIF